MVGSRTRGLTLAIALVVTLVSAAAGALATPPPVAAAACGIPTCTLTVVITGNGSGSWKTTTSSFVPNGFIACEIVNGVKTPGSVCSHTYGGEERATPLLIYYTVTAATGSQECTIAPACFSGGSYSELFTLSSDLTTQAQFTLKAVPFGVRLEGTGMGQVASTPSGILCLPTCGKVYVYGTQVALTAVAASGSYFGGWARDCLDEQTATCQVTVGLVDVEVTAIFTLGSPPTPSPPAPTPVATPVATPKATVKPTGTPVPGKTAAATAGATAAAAPSVGQGTDEPSSTAEPTASPAAATPEGSGAPTAPLATEPPVSPAVGGSDFTPIVLAILGAGLLIALGIGFAAYMLRRRTAPPS